MTWEGHAIDAYEQWFSEIWRMKVSRYISVSRYTGRKELIRFLDDDDE